MADATTAAATEYDYQSAANGDVDAGADGAVSVSVSGLEGPPQPTAVAPTPVPSSAPAAAASPAAAAGKGQILKLTGRPAGTPTAAANGTAAAGAVTPTATVATPAGQPLQVLGGDTKQPSPTAAAAAAAAAAAGAPGSVAKVCVKFLPVSYSEKELTDMLTQFGPVSNPKIIREHPSGTSKGYGFAEFGTVNEANAAIAALNGLQLESKTLRVELANSAGTSAAPGAPAQAQQYAPIQGFAGYQPQPAPQLNLLAQPQQSQYAPQGAPQQYYAAPAAVRPGVAPAPGTGDHTNLYVAGLPITFQKTDLEQLFSGFGVVQHVHMLLDKATGQGRGVGFVRLDTTEACQAAISSLHGTAPYGLQQPITVRFSRQDGPPPRSGAPPIQPTGYGPYRRAAQHTQSYDPYGRPQDDAGAAAPVAVQYAVPTAAAPVSAAAPPQAATVQYQDAYGNPVQIATVQTAAAPAAAAAPQYYLAATPQGTAAAGPVAGQQLVAIAPTTPGGPTTYAYIATAPAQPAVEYQQQTVLGADGQYYTQPVAVAAQPAVQYAQPAYAPQGVYAAAQPQYAAQAAPAVAAAGGDPTATLFVFHLPQDFSDEEMRALFAPYGSMTQCRVVRDKTTGTNRGFGFVSYNSVAEATSAINGLNGFAVRNKHLRVSFKKAGQQG